MIFNIPDNTDQSVTSSYGIITNLVQDQNALKSSAAAKWIVTILGLCILLT